MPFFTWVISGFNHFLNLAYNIQSYAQTFNLHFIIYQFIKFLGKNPSLTQFIPAIYNKIIIKILGYFWGVTEMAPYEALYGRKCRTPLCWDEVGERKLLGPEIVQVTTDNVKVIRDRLKIAQD